MEILTFPQPGNGRPLGQVPGRLLWLRSSFGLLLQVAFLDARTLANSLQRNPPDTIRYCEFSTEQEQGQEEEQQQHEQQQEQEQEQPQSQPRCFLWLRFCLRLFSVYVGLDCGKTIFNSNLHKRRGWPRWATSNRLIQSEDIQDHWFLHRWISAINPIGMIMQSNLASITRL